MAAEPIFPDGAGCRRIPVTDDILDRECRNLIESLSHEMQRLCHPGIDQRERLRCLRVTASSLATLISLLKSPNQSTAGDSHGRQTDRVLEDAQGTVYRSIRNCELEQWFTVK